jgi:ATP-dependent protease ClpP protease subunit
MPNKKYTLDFDGYIGYWTSGKRYTKQVLSDAGDTEVLIRVNSMGGNLDDAIDIAAQFEAHGRVTCEFFALNASAATILTLGAQKVRAHVYSSYLIHKALTWIDSWGYMNEDDLDTTIETLKREQNNVATQTLIIARMYAKRSGKQLKDILNLMKEEKWLTALEAKEWGFVDEVFSEAEAVPAPVTDTEITFLLNAAGLPPLPKRPDAFRSNDSLQDENRTMLASILSGLTSLVNSFTNNKNTSQMKKDYSFVNTLLSVEGIEFKSDRAELTEEQVKLINETLNQAGKDKKNKEDVEAKIAGKDTEITNLKVQIAEKDKEVANLKTEVDRLNGAAGDDTAPVSKKTDDTMKGEAQQSDYVANARKLFHAMPD